MHGPHRPASPAPGSKDVVTAIHLWTLDTNLFPPRRPKLPEKNCTYPQATYLLLSQVSTVYLQGYHTAAVSEAGRRLSQREPSRSLPANT